MQKTINLIEMGNLWWILWPGQVNRFLHVTLGILAHLTHQKSLAMLQFSHGFCQEDPELFHALEISKMHSEYSGFVNYSWGVLNECKQRQREKLKGICLFSPAHNLKLITLIKRSVGRKVTLSGIGSLKISSPILY